MLNTIIEKPPLRIYDYSDYDDYSDNDEEFGIIQHNYNRRETFIDKIINCVAYCDRGVEYFFQALDFQNNSFLLLQLHLYLRSFLNKGI